MSNLSFFYVLGVQATTYRPLVPRVCRQPTGKPGRSKNVSRSMRRNLTAVYVDGLVADPVASEEDDGGCDVVVGAGTARGDVGL